MTIKEYVKKYYSTQYSLIFEQGFYYLFYQTLFPFGAQVVNKESINYLPFEYETNTSYGGAIAEDVSAYICENYKNVDINDLYIIGNHIDISPYSTPSALKQKMYHILRNYKYKWNGLYKTTIVDNEYNMLDNVNEIFDETTTRTPNLNYSENGSNIYGQRETTQDNTYGSLTKTNENQYGSITETTQETIGNKTDTTSQTIGALSVDSSTSKTQADDTITTLNKNVPNNSVTSKLVNESDVTNTHGNISETNSTDTSAQTNSSSNIYGSQNNTTSKSVPTHSDILEEEISQHNDVLTQLTRTHTDTNSNLKTETGEEETVITRRRHGNIGVTTSGQLIEDFRKTHYFDLIKIIGEDIANEILSMVW